VDLGLSSKTALVTGVSQGIGLAIADVFLEEGMRVLGTSRRPPPTRDGLDYLQLDMTDPNAGETAVDAALERLGHLDVLVNNVGGLTVRDSFQDQTGADWWGY
jgi:NAD(P)-dependent dehydrogenase (short-subunit alcohol dehydrogenase family)